MPIKSKRKVLVLHSSIDDVNVGYSWGDAAGQDDLDVQFARLEDHLVENEDGEMVFDPTGLDGDFDAIVLNAHNASRDGIHLTFTEAAELRTKQILQALVHHQQTTNTKLLLQTCFGEDIINELESANDFSGVTLVSVGEKFAVGGEGALYKSLLRLLLTQDQIEESYRELITSGMLIPFQTQLLHKGNLSSFGSVWLSGDEDALQIVRKFYERDDVGGREVSCKTLQECSEAEFLLLCSYFILRNETNSLRMIHSQRQLSKEQRLVLLLDAISIANYNAIDFPSLEVLSHRF